MTRMNCHIALLALSLMLLPRVSIAELYLGVAPHRLTVKAAANKTRPTAVSLTIGYALSEHRFELIGNVSSSEDRLNQLRIDVPAYLSLAYRYLVNPESDVQFDVMLGASTIDIESEYPSIPTATESFEGLSYGFGIEEAIRSLPELKVRFEYTRLYDGETLDVESLSLGVRYVF